MKIIIYPKIYGQCRKQSVIFNIYYNKRDISNGDIFECIIDTQNEIFKSKRKMLNSILFVLIVVQLFFDQWTL